MQMCSAKKWLPVSFFVIALAAGCATKPSDAQLATNLKAQMFSDPQTKNADLQVAVKNGVVTLSGTAPSGAARYEAYKLATNLPGVTKVNDQMAVQAPVQTAEAAPPAPSAPVEPPPPAKPKRVPTSSRSAHKKHPHHPADTDSVSSADQSPAQAIAPAPPTQTSQPTTSAPPPTAASAPANPPADGSAQPPTQAPAPPPPPSPVTAVFPAGSTIEVRTVDAIDSKTGQAGDQFQATLQQPLTWNGQVLVPKGANVYLRLTEVQTSGQYKGKSELQLQLVRLEFQGTDYPLTSTTYTEAGASRGQDTAKTVGGGALVGAIIGAIAGGGKGAVIGGAAGAGAGGVYQGVSKPKQIRIPSETVLDFKLDQPLTVPVPATNESQ
jgi:hypothetical protein